MKVRNQPASPAHKAFIDDLKAALGRHTNLSGMEMLAVVSQFLGSIIAFQDRRRFTAEEVMEIVGQNIEVGNQIALESLLRQPEGRA
jgi:hypothetical protein